VIAIFSNEPAILTKDSFSSFFPDRSGEHDSFSMLIPAFIKHAQLIEKPIERIPVKNSPVVISLAPCPAGSDPKCRRECDPGRFYTDMRCFCRITRNYSWTIILTSKHLRRSSVHTMIMYDLRYQKFPKVANKETSMMSESLSIGIRILNRCHE
jgi:hypothetical protein